MSSRSTSTSGSTATVVFDLNDIDAAIAELDARYLAGEAAAHAHAWSIVAGSYAALNRHELPSTTPDCLYIDHRRETAFGPGDLTAYVQAGFDLDQGINTYVEQVHRLNGLEAVITYAAHETSQEGFHAEWRGVAVLTADGDMINRCEVFDEADLDAALARFERATAAGAAAGKLSDPSGSTASWTRFAARDWDAMATELIADDFSTVDRSPSNRERRRSGAVEITAIAEMRTPNADVGARERYGRRWSQHAATRFALIRMLRR